MSVDAQKLIEQHALELMHMNRFDWLDCEGLFQLMEQLWTKEKQRKCVQSRGQYLSFGMFAHGPMSGVTSKAKVFPHTVQYINAFIWRLVVNSGEP